MDRDSQLFKMRRMLLDSRYSQNQNSENIDTTPLRRSSVNFPRVRLLEKDFKSVSHAFYTFSICLWSIIAKIVLILFAAG